MKDYRNTYSASLEEVLHWVVVAARESFEGTPTCLRGGAGGGGREALAHVLPRQPLHGKLDDLGDVRWFRFRFRFHRVL